MNVNVKGTRGLIETISDLYNKNYSCFTPFDDYSPVDVIAMKPDGTLIRLQVKYRKKSVKHGKVRDSYELPTASVVNGKKVPIDRSKIDGWALYMVDDDRMEYIPVEELEGKSSKHVKSSEHWDWIRKCG